MSSESLEALVQGLVDERAITRRLYDYAHGLDYGPEEAFVDNFTDDATWQRLPGRRPAQVFSGRAALQQMYRDHVHAPEYFHKHMVANAKVDVDGDTAAARSYLILIAEHPTGPYVRGFSRCTDHIIRCADGQWRIQDRKAELENWSDRDFPPRPWTQTPEVVG